MSLDEILLKRFDDLISKKGYSNRSEALRDLIRDALVMEEWQGTTAETVGTITIVYSHQKRELPDLLTRLQHLYHNLIISSMHIHLDEHNCLELIAVKGKAKDLKKIADRLIGAKGVKHGKLSLTTTGKQLKWIFFFLVVEIRDVGSDVTYR
jgi:CopG family nickel-responsive transcriptional regulator